MANVFGGVIFVMVFVLMAPATRAFLMTSAVAASTWMTAWSPISFILIGVVLAAPIAGLAVIKTWPAHVEPENPMAKYRREAVHDGD